ncbi:nuclease-related domain-containing protein [Massilia sp. Se16.2.3]|uniref:nuclease-related domain-containing protein n=1 Tax=Massilia sp. Se16.2.3 TaxID=2709303 RepID=UPI00160258D3|nr:nuclease-related domain-containing protein [Massilia sp. Se16.2.3]QNA99422.1 NERD domain-containing protein [Massilia sp. Se16.2.3]
MIYKDIDNKEPVVAILERMLKLAGPDKQPLIERELRAMRAGIRSEREATCLLDSWLRNATRTAVIHDLRLDSRSGHVAQIDHVLIHRTRRFYILDTKCFAQDVRILDDGSYLRWNADARRFEPAPSPLAQCEHNARVLRRALAHLGLQDVAIDALVLVAPTARIERPRRFDTSALMKADVFLDRLHGLSEGPAARLRPWADCCARACTIPSATSPSASPGCTGRRPPTPWRASESAGAQAAGRHARIGSRLGVCLGSYRPASAGPCPGQQPGQHPRRGASIGLTRPPGAVEPAFSAQPTACARRSVRSGRSRD